jgi:hypothetical protein
MSPSAKIIADSLSPWGTRLTTFEIVIHRFVLAELNTHRVFSRNSASSRAIPLRKQLDKVIASPAIPVVWPGEQKGMQGGDEIEDIVSAQIAWREASSDAAMRADELGTLGVHKSIANRLLEPFMWHTVVLTAVSWENFYIQRCSPLAQPEIRVVAEMMQAAHKESVPEPIREGFWHLPYIDREDIEAAEKWVLDNHGAVSKKRVTGTLVSMSAARCARVSYLTQDGKREVQADLDLYDRLVTAKPWHGSPLEHPATPDPTNATRAELAFTDVWGNDRMIERTIPLIGNFIGWRQLRAEVEAAYDLEPLR